MYLSSTSKKPDGELSEKAQDILLISLQDWHSIIQLSSTTSTCVGAKSLGMDQKICET